MTVHNPGLEADLNAILTILGTTKRSFWPFWESTGQLVTGIGVGDMIPSETAGAAEDLEHDFAPLLLPCGLYSYHFHPTGDHHLAGVDHANYSFAGAAFSVGAWIRPTAIASNVILAKYDVAGTDREYRFWIDAAGKLDLELFDESVDTTEIAISDAALTAGQLQFVVATYDGTSATPAMWLYVNGVAVNDGSSTEAGAFVAMEAGATPLTIACGDDSAAPTNEFHGRIAMPFLTGKELTAANVVALRDIMRPMVGIC